MHLLLMGPNTRQPIRSSKRRALLLYHFLPVLMPVDVVGTVIDIYTCICVYGNGGTMANADKRMILAVFH